MKFEQKKQRKTERRMSSTSLTSPPSPSSSSTTSSSGSSNNNNHSLDTTLLILNHVNTLLLALRTGAHSVINNLASTSSSANASRDLDSMAQRAQLHPLLTSLYELREKLTRHNSRVTLSIQDVIVPFMDIVVSEDVTSPVTSLALDALIKMMKSEYLNPQMDNAQKIMNSLVNCIMHVQFEVSDTTSDEITLLRVLNAFTNMITCAVGALLNSQQILNIIKSIFRIGRETRPTEILRSSADMALSEIIINLFTKPRDQQQVDYREIFNYFIELSDPEYQGKSISSRVLGLSMCLVILEALGFDSGNNNDMKIRASKFKIYDLICDKYSRSLLRNVQTGATHNLQLLNLVLRSMSHLFLKLSAEDFENQKTEFLTHLHFRVLNPSTKNPLISIYPGISPLIQNSGGSNNNGASGTSSSGTATTGTREVFSIETIELILEHLIELCREPDFIMELYLFNDSTLNRRDLFAQLCSLLVGVLKESGDTLSYVHGLALSATLSIVRCLSERCGKIVPTTGTKLQKVRETKRFKNLYIQLAIQLNTNIKNGLNALKRFYWSQLQQQQSTNSVAINVNLSSTLSTIPDTQLDVISMNIAKFMHQFAYWLDKEAIAEVLKRDDELCNKILHYYMNVFDIKGLRIDEALRFIVWHFKLSGEGQQLERILKEFGHAYYNQNSDRTYLMNGDECWYLSVAILLLHTDLHHIENKRKMTVDQWLMNTDYINGGKLDEVELRTIYQDVLKYEFVSSATVPTGAFMSAPVWNRLIHEQFRAGQSSLDYEQIASLNLDIDMFTTMWSGTLLSTSIVLESTTDADILETSIRGFLDSARVAAHYQLTQIFDNLVITLTKYTSLVETTKFHKMKSKKAYHYDYQQFEYDEEPSLVNSHHAGDSDAYSYYNSGQSNALSQHHSQRKYSGPKYQQYNQMYSYNDNVLDNSHEADRRRRESQSMASKFGADEKAQIACRTVFAITRNYGDNLREGWRDIVSLICKMFTLKILPKSLLQLLNKEENSYARKIENEKDELSIRSTTSSYLFGFFGNSNDDDLLERQAIERAKKCIQQCRIDDLLQSVHVLNMNSLEYLIRALVQNFARAVTSNGSESVSMGANIGEEVYYMNSRSYLDLFMWDLLTFVCVKNCEQGIIASDQGDRLNVVLNHLSKLIDKCATSGNHIDTMHHKSDAILQYCLKMVLKLTCILIIRIQSNNNESKNNSVTDRSDSDSPKPNTAILQNAFIKKCIDMISTLLRKSGNSTGAMSEDCYHLLATFIDKIYIQGTDNDSNNTSEQQSNNQQLIPSNYLEMIDCIFVQLMQPRQQMVDPNPTYFSLLAALVKYECYSQQPLHLSILVSCLTNYGVQIPDTEKETLYQIPNLIDQIHKWCHKTPDRLQTAWLEAYILSLQSLSVLSARGCKILRSASLNTLQRILISLVDVYPSTSHDLLILVIHRCVFTLLNELLGAMEKRLLQKNKRGFFSASSSNNSSKTETNANSSIGTGEFTLSIQQGFNIDLASLEEIQFRACHLLAKIFLHYLPMVSTLDDFDKLWTRILSYMSKYLSMGSDLLHEAIPELVKNIVLVMNNLKIFKEKAYLWSNVEQELSQIVPGLLAELREKIVLNENVTNQEVEEKQAQNQ